MLVEHWCAWVASWRAKKSKKEGRLEQDAGGTADRVLTLDSDECMPEASQQGRVRTTFTIQA